MNSKETNIICLKIVKIYFVSKYAKIANMGEILSIKLLKFFFTAIFHKLCIGMYMPFNEIRLGILILFAIKFKSHISWPASVCIYFMLTAYGFEFP